MRKAGAGNQMTYTSLYGPKLWWLLFKRDLKLRYAGAGFGSLWNILQPVLLFGVYALVFGYFLKFKARLLGHQIDFLPYLFAGFWPWVAFNDGVLRSAFIVLEYAAIIKRVRFPVGVLVPLAVLSALTPLLVGFLLLGIFLAFKGGLHLSLSRAPFLLVPLGMQLLLSLGLGFLVASVTAYVRDVQQLLPSLMNLWFFLTPVFYSLDLVPVWLRGVLSLNPWSTILSWYRMLFLSPSLSWDPGDFWVFGLGCLLCLSGYLCFKRASRYFPEILG